jgi:hypothetical protein
MQLMIPHDRSAEHYARVVREALPGEPILDAARRLMVLDFVDAFGSQKKAAEQLGVSRGVIHREVHAAIAKRVNARIGREDLNRTQRGRSHAA